MHWLSSFIEVLAFALSRADAIWTFYYLTAYMRAVRPESSYKFKFAPYFISRFTSSEFWQLAAVIKALSANSD